MVEDADDERNELVQRVAHPVCDLPDHRHPAEEEEGEETDHVIDSIEDKVDNHVRRFGKNSGVHVPMGEVPQLMRPQRWR